MKKKSLINNQFYLIKDVEHFMLDYIYLIIIGNFLRIYKNKFKQVRTFKNIC